MNSLDKKGGFSLVEVLVSLVLMSIMALLVARMLQYNVLMVRQTAEIRDNIYAAQNLAEVAYAAFDKQTSSNPATLDISVVPTTTGEGIDVGKHQYISSELPSGIFGLHDLTAYTYTVSILDETGAKLYSVNCGTANKKFNVNIDEKRPTLDALTLEVLNAGSSLDTDTNVLYFPENYPTVAVTAKPGTGDKVYKNLFQWYMTFGNTHVTDTVDDRAKTSFPNDYTFIPDTQYLSDSATATSTLTDLAEYKGSFITATATPGSIEGYYGGTTVADGSLYISALPVLTDGMSYHALYDVSNSNPVVKTGGRIEILSAQKVPGAGSTANMAVNNVYSDLVTLQPASTETEPAETNNEKYPSINSYFSRYISVSKGSGMNVPMPAGETTIICYAVVRADMDKNVDPLNERLMYVSTSVDSVPAETDRKVVMGNKCGTDVYDKDKWFIVRQSLSAPSGISKLYIGENENVALDIAELLLVDSSYIISAESDPIVQYLSDKYGIAILGGEGAVLYPAPAEEG